MAKNRSRRLRKKMHIDEFQELGFSVAWRFPEGRWSVAYLNILSCT